MISTTWRMEAVAAYLVTADGKNCGTSLEWRTRR